MTDQPKHILVGVTGSIAAYKACDIIRRLKQSGYRVSVMMTAEAKQFITPLTLATLSGEPVYADWFDDTGHAWRMHHVEWGGSADLILIAPATANIIAKLWAGMADDPVSGAVLASPAPVVIVPAMNDTMYEHPLLQRNCEDLRAAGYTFVDPVVGDLACGRSGPGHIADVEQIIAQVQALLTQ